MTLDVHLTSHLRAFDPLIYGDYPPEMRQYLESALPSFTSDEKMLIKDSIDFIRINHYGTLYAKDCIYSSCVCSNSSCIAGGDHPIHGYLITLAEKDGVFIGEPTGMPRFFVVPSGMEEIVDYMKKRYPNKPMFVTENGSSSLNPTTAQAAELQHDIKRVEFHKSYLASLAQAIRNGGYGNSSGFNYGEEGGNSSGSGGYATSNYGGGGGGFSSEADMKNR